MALGRAWTRCQNGTLPGRSINPFSPTLDAPTASRYNPPAFQFVKKQTGARPSDAW